MHFVSVFAECVPGLKVENKTTAWSFTSETAAPMWCLVRAHCPIMGSESVLLRRIGSFCAGFFSLTEVSSEHAR
jgi:hypothetical protein